MTRPRWLAPLLRHYIVAFYVGVLAILSLAAITAVAVVVIAPRLGVG